MEADKGAAATNVDPGDRIWWDRHDWSQAYSIPAVVGSYPEPFLNGYDGRRYPVRIGCASVTSVACRTVTARLRDAGVPAAIAAIGTGGEPEEIQVLVGPWTSVLAYPGTQTIEDGPRASGVYARFSANGSSLTLLDAEGHAVRTLGAGAGLLAATRQAESAPVWVITGTDETGVDRAAEALTEQVLDNHFAVAVAPQGTVALPVVEEMSVAPRASALAYRRRASPLHATSGPVAAAYGVALALAALLTENPLLLLSLLVAVLAAGAAAGVRPQMARVAAKSAVPIVVLSVVVNLLVSREGLTVFARLGEWGPLGQVDLTVEALVYGLVFGLRLLVVDLACVLAICTADPDQLLLACRRFSPRSALTVSLATRLIPVLGQDARRLAEAQRCRPDGGARTTAAKLALLRATVAGALDRALDVAAVLEMRGYGAPDRGRHARGPRAMRASGAARRCAGAPATTSPSPPPPARSSRSRCSRPPAARLPSTRTRCSGSAVDARVLALCALLVALATRALRRSPGDRAVSVLRFDRVSYSYPDARRRRAARRQPRARAGRVLRARRPVRLGQVHAAARGRRAGAALPRRQLRRNA